MRVRAGEELAEETERRQKPVGLLLDLLGVSLLAGFGYGYGYDFDFGYGYKSGSGVTA